jgi:putative endonuclease
MAEYFVYILSNKSRMLYVGVTSNLERRVFEHRMKLVPGFTEHYGLAQLVYYESTGDVTSAISREKEIKGWVRRKKVALIHSFNPEWKDLSLEWTSPNPDTLRCAQGDRGERSGDRGSAQGDRGSKPYLKRSRIA